MSEESKEYELGSELDRVHALNRDYTHRINVLEAKVERLSSRGIEDMQHTITELTQSLKEANDKILELTL